MANILPISDKRTDQGDTGVAYAIQWFMTHGYSVCVPISEHQDFDLVVVEPGCPAQKVQVKTSRVTTDKPGAYEVALRTTNGNNKAERDIRHFDSCTADLLWVLVDDGRMWLIPRKAVMNRSSLTVGGNKYGEFQV